MFAMPARKYTDEQQETFFESLDRSGTARAAAAAAGVHPDAGYRWVRRAGIATESQSRSYGLDPVGNVRTITATGVAAGTPTSTVHHYGGGGDSPSWTIDTSSTGTVTSRFLGGLSGDPVATATSGATTGISLSWAAKMGGVGFKALKGKHHATKWYHRTSGGIRKYVGVGRHTMKSRGAYYGFNTFAYSASIGAYWKNQRSR